MTKPRTKNGAGATFPYFVKNGSITGRIKRWGNGTFGTFFSHGGKKHRNSFGSFEAAHESLTHELETITKNTADSHSLFPVRHELRTYHELETILREKGDGATLREAVDFYLENRTGDRLMPKPLDECVSALLASVETLNLSSTHVETLTRHLGHFKRSFGTRKIHEITAAEIGTWLGGQGWSAKTRINTRGSLLRLFLFAQKMLSAIRKGTDVAPQLVDDPKEDAKGEVEIYTPAEMQNLLIAARDHYPEMLPAIVLQGLLGLRPDEVHAENADREPLPWSAFNWHDSLLHVEGQKVRSKATRDVPLNASAKSWLKPEAKPEGNVWTFKKSYTKKMKVLCAKAGVPRIDNGLRHSYASYRVRQLKGDLAKLAEEMGNSPGEIVNHYKKNVKDVTANEWFKLTRAQLSAVPTT